MTTESKHTKGPLCVWGQQAKTEIGGFYMIGRKDQRHGCTAYVAGEDNARLYAAAPDLLEALREVLAIAPLYPEMVAKVRAALAKAEGKPESEPVSWTHAYPVITQGH